MFAIYHVFLLKATALGMATVLTIPKDDYRRLFAYGFVFGALSDTVLVLILTLSGLLRYINMGPYSTLGFIPFWTPMAWGFAFMLFFRFLPARKVFLYLYLAGWTWLSYSLGLMLKNLGLLRFVDSWFYWSPLIYLSWYAVSAWAYLRVERMELK